jgi:hypothetical protein
VAREGGFFVFWIALFAVLWPVIFVSAAGIGRPKP